MVNTIKFFKRLNDLLLVEETENRASAKHFVELAYSAGINRYWSNEEFSSKRGNKKDIVDYFSYLENMENRYQQLLNSVMESKKVKEFIEKNKNFISYYSMGETIEVKFVYFGKTETKVFVDKREKYARSCKWRGSETYGYVRLVADATGKRMKYTIEEKSKK